MLIPTAKRVQNVHRSFVREILKATTDPKIISFAGGLPNPKFIPVKQIAEAVQVTLAEQGAAALQYCTSEGHPPLRQWIADQYNAAGLNVDADQILITTGSQQGFDLLGKVLLDPGDRVVVEDPTYPAALQAWGMYEPVFCAVPTSPEGIDATALSREIESGAKMLYCMPNFQNPTGGSYSAGCRADVADALRGSSTVLVEDDPYGLLRFSGTKLPPIACHLPEQSVLLGTFSKTVAPGLRLGWICAPKQLMEKLIIAKQAVDLHSENLGQWVIHRLVTSGQFEQHLQAIRDVYGRQCRTMIDAIEQYLPREVRTTRPEGGMFLWVTLPSRFLAINLFERAIKKGVAFVPGQPFFANGGGEHSMRLNFSNSDETRIVEGIRRLASAMEEL
ncbi:MAG TPA: PLP-dependent aminotransferase family protein [Tepidisphaeraceae bacterium]|jgi:2-aminoadipate transaminase